MVELSKLCKNTRKDLDVKIYIIGYKDKGESIIVLVKDLERVVFSSIIDGYKTDELNIAKSILDGEKVEKIDVCCWTHPHEDHCKGFLEILENKICKENTIFLLPEGVYCEDDGFFDYSDSEKEILKEFNKSLENHRVKDRNVKTVNVDECEKRLFINCKLKLMTGEIIPFQIFAVAPNSTVIRSSRKKGKLKPNEVSIGLIYSIDNDFVIFLGGDMENKTINLLEKDIFKDISIIKIPHHASDGANKILDLLGTDKRDDIIACSTTFRHGISNLPTSSVIDEYKKKTGKVLCTGKISPSDEKDNFGVIKFEYNLGLSYVTYNFSGNAVEI